MQRTKRSSEKSKIVIAEMKNLKKKNLLDSKTKRWKIGKNKKRKKKEKKRKLEKSSRSKIQITGNPESRQRE